MSNRFVGAQERWLARMGKLRDIVRQELITRQLDEQLLAGPARVLDVGCGQGTQVLRLACRGHTVTGVDSATDLLGVLRRDLAAQPPAVQDRVRVVNASIAEMTDLLEPETFDVVLCHGVLMYFDDPTSVLREIARTLAPGGMASLLVRNGDALAMRPGLLGDWSTSLAAFDAQSYVNRLGLIARADRLEELTARLASAGMSMRDWYGVRVFTDLAADDAVAPSGAELEALLSCEERAGRTDPYRSVAALLHVIAARDVTTPAATTPAA